MVAPMQYSQMIWAILFGVFLFQESVDLLTILGAGIIIASGVFIVLREARGDALPPLLSLNPAVAPS